MGRNDTKQANISTLDLGDSKQDKWDTCNGKHEVTKKDYKKHFNHIGSLKVIKYRTEVKKRVKGFNRLEDRC